MYKILFIVSHLNSDLASIETVVYTNQNAVSLPAYGNTQGTSLTLESGDPTGKILLGVSMMYAGDWDAGFSSVAYNYALLFNNTGTARTIPANGIKVHSRWLKLG